MRILRWLTGRDREQDQVTNAVLLVTLIMATWNTLALMGWLS